ncbi:asparagine synthase (glutamine-hydrolyzing) [uncultured Rhodoblastus sp.]|uniref:asparagine synthase (glutamine-hydrolyzing) n=1 Tax=uncultured Rhodoblastus sp. TaxID=543037 RepID=UPI0025EE329C|nr:asparagine synthase (glutamine-hydrolyzing) [uncultured Rhodoblastus sp.]
MCGINGIFAYHGAAAPVKPTEVRSTRDYMARRGPDDSGEFYAWDMRIGFGHRRLTIIDLSDRGAQPMKSRDGRYVITFNGEIYNFRELRRELEASGVEFCSESDTEVLLNLYAAKGEAMLQDLRGMFAFAIWDAARENLFLARDCYGIKPLYYNDDGRTFRFASQVKALLAGGGVSREPDPAGAVGFHLFGSVPEPFTSYLNIRALQAGAALLLNSRGSTIRRHHSIAEIYSRAQSSKPAEPVDVREALRESVRRHLVADVPVGAFLSSGIDSGALVGLMRDVGAIDIKTITVGFNEFLGWPEDETRLAAEVAKTYGAKHTTRFVSRAEFEADLPKIFEAMDQPSIDGVNGWFVSKAARELGLKVAISGLGGDELFGGYPSFSDLPRWSRFFSLPSQIPFLGSTARTLMVPMTSAFGLSPKAAGMLEYGGSYPGAYLLRRGLFMPWELGSVLDQETVKLGMQRLSPLQLIGAEFGGLPLQDRARVAVLESSFYMRNQLLRDIDWASMAHSLEVRTPLVDCTLLASLAASGGPHKSDLAAAPAIALPSVVTNRLKTGFSIPIDAWMGRLVEDKGKGHARPQSAYRAWARFVWKNSVGAS